MSLIDPELLSQIDASLSEAEIPRGCTLGTTLPVRGYSFWQSLEQIEKASQLDRTATADTFQKNTTTTRQDVEQFRSFATIEPCPIVAVCGMLNSGKSSLIAGFLSAAGRARVLVGSDDESGTHRFVIWLPKAWQDRPLLWSASQQQIKDAFGVAGELLSDEPELARRQYNGSAISSTSRGEENSIEHFRKPLIAFDSNLDSLGLGLMDCPDVQRGEFGHQEVTSTSSTKVHEANLSQRMHTISAMRLQVLQAGMRLSSAMIVVVQASMMGDLTMVNLVNNIRDVMPSVKCFVAINRVAKKYKPTQIASEIAQYYAAGTLSGIFLAYDFRGSQNTDKLPPPPTQWKSIQISQALTQTHLPIFFDVEKYHSASGEIAYLLDLGTKLDRGKLAIDLVNSLANRLELGLQDRFEHLDQALTEQAKLSNRLYKVIANAIARFTTGDSSGQTQVRLQLSPDVLAQWHQSLERTAPWWAKPSQVVSRWSSYITKSLKNYTAKIPGLPSLGNGMKSMTDFIASKIRGGENASVMTPEELSNALRACDRNGDLPSAMEARHTSSGSSPDILVNASSEIIERFQLYSRTQLPTEQLDQLSATIWKKMGWKERFVKGVAPVTVVVAPLVAVVMIPFDFGTTHVLVFASLKELMFAGVAGAGILLTQSDFFWENAESQAAWKQISDLFALSCDVLGLERPPAEQLPLLGVAGKDQRLLQSNIDPLPPGQARVFEILAWQAGFEQRFGDVIQNLKSFRSTLDGSTGANLE